MTTGNGFASAASTTLLRHSVLKPIREVKATQLFMKLRRLMPLFKQRSHRLSRFSTFVPPYKQYDTPSVLFVAK